MPYLLFNSLFTYYYLLVEDYAAVLVNILRLLEYAGCISKKFNHFKIVFDIYVNQISRVPEFNRHLYSFGMSVY